MFSLAVKRQKSYEEHISAYLLSLAYLGLDDKLLKKKKSLWRRFLTSEGSSQLNYYKKLLKFQYQQNAIILKALKKMEEMKQEDTIGSIGSLYKPFTWGVSSFEFAEGS